MTAKHTPGPWIADDGEIGEWGIFQQKDSNAIAYLTEDGKLCRPPEAKANAHLLSAAPDLLEACEALRNTLEAYHSEEECHNDLCPTRLSIQRATKTIIKARGEQ